MFFYFLKIGAVNNYQYQGDTFFFFGISNQPSISGSKDLKQTKFSDFIDFMSSLTPRMDSPTKPCRGQVLPPPPNAWWPQPGTPPVFGPKQTPHLGMPQQTNHEKS